MNPDLEPVHNADIRWLVRRLHVGTPAREVLREIRDRLTAGLNFATMTRTERRSRRRYAYAAALHALTEARAEYRDVMNGTLSNPEPRPRYYFNRTTRETTIQEPAT